MPRGLDHIVHAVRDLDAAAEFYRRAGFQVGARNRHPWGTHNHVVQFPGFFIEILTVAEPEKLTGEGLPRIFGGANRDAIARGDGFSMLLLESPDAEADRADFERAGIAASAVLPFSRTATLPDGGTTTVGFSLAFAADARSPHAGFAVCRQHNPAAFWKPDYQVHANGDLDDVAPREVAFEFGPAELGGFEVELGAEDVAGRHFRYTLQGASYKRQVSGICRRRGAG